ncbi:divalent-cation tolerance protein CutA [Sphingomonas sp. BGYR3]|uniref:divalent-cation tolerance protein CutA n=1 Tax=Sphingomonas sp. BGYR3 TaxID=2975483 RepID=UPI0021A766B4|nr:divalent-cation tolerance protein CutA [Sphingomonas sp. BGYR3]
MTGLTLVYTTLDSVDRAADIAGTVVEERLAACAQVLAPITSTYRWQGKVETAQEWPLLLKVASTDAERLIERLGVLHPYDLPVIEWWPASTTPGALAWLAESVA